MLKKLFSGKKSAYFLELDESKKTEPAQEKKAASAKPVEEKKAEPAKAKKTDEPKAEPTKAKETEAPKAASAQAKKTSVKDKAKAAPAAPASKDSKPTISDPEEIVRAAVFKNNNSNGKADSQSNGFASNNVIVPTMSRRRPGPSLNMFKNMARQAKTPKN